MWLHAMRVSDVDAERFRMNGKALCLMTSEMFAYRVPVGGTGLFKDFRQRLCQALLPHSKAAWWREEQ